MVSVWTEFALNHSYLKRHLLDKYLAFLSTCVEVWCSGTAGSLDPQHADGAIIPVGMMSSVADFHKLSRILLAPCCIRAVHVRSVLCISGVVGIVSSPLLTMCKMSAIIMEFG